MQKRNSHRVIIEDVTPIVDRGEYPIKRVPGETVSIEAGIFTDGHQKIAADILWRKSTAKAWKREPLSFVENDQWRGSFVPQDVGAYEYTIEAWVDPFLTWQGVIERVIESRPYLTSELPVGVSYLEMMLEEADDHDAPQLQRYLNQVAENKSVEAQAKILIEPELQSFSRKYLKGEGLAIYAPSLKLEVTREKTLFSSWYEMFPRSCGDRKHGTFADAIKRLPYIAEMGFDVLYLPPIHPVGETHRKGKNNSLKASKKDPGSPWAIGSEEGGHKAINPSLGTMKEFTTLVDEANSYGIEVALDLAFQCSPDHPYVKEHPEWFRWRPDGTVQYAENPPKKYQDIVPFDFDTTHWKELWEELKSVVLFWNEKGVKIFRVDNPHTKPFAFWEWLIAEVKKVDPSVILLSEAFTRPRVMQYLAKVGFDQSYTYFSWRNSKHEIISYVTELTQSETREYFRPNFWPNTPDILPVILQNGGRPAFIVRAVLAATLSSNYGIYGPAFELCCGDGIEGTEEYLNSEKYEIKEWNLNDDNSIAEIIGGINRIRKEHPAFQTTWNVEFVETENDALLGFIKYGGEGNANFLVAVNLDMHHKHAGMVHLPLAKLGIEEKTAFMAHDLITNDKYVWEDERNYIELSPHHVPVHIIQLQPTMIKEKQFDYFA